MTADGKLPALKVLQIGKYFYPDEGGIETVTLGISTALAAENIQADVLCFARHAAYNPITAPPYDVVRARPDFVIGTRIFSSDYVAKVRDLAPRYDAALLHCPNPLAMAAALLFWRKPLILIWHADILPYPALAPLIRPLERASIRQAAAIVSPTIAHTEGSYLASRMVAKREIIPLPFDATRLPAASQDNAELRTVLAFLAGRQLVLAVGRLVPYKGFDVLIKAIATMDPRLAVVVVGTGPEATALAAVSAAAGGGRSYIVYRTSGRCRARGALRAGLRGHHAVRDARRNVRHDAGRSDVVRQAGRPRPASPAQESTGSTSMVSPD